MHGQALTFLGIVMVLTVTPGADMALVMRNVLAHGPAAMWPTIAGIFSAIAVHVTVCVAGLGLLLAGSTLAFTTIKLAGAAWLAWLGLQALLEARHHRSAARSLAFVPAQTQGAGEQPAGLAPTASTRRLWTSGFLTNLLNVKIVLFYLAFLPQFAPAGDRFVPVALSLALVQAAIGLAWLTSYGLVVARAGRALGASPRARAWLEGLTGVALIGFGVRLATAAR